MVFKSILCVVSMNILTHVFLLDMYLRGALYLRNHYRLCIKEASGFKGMQASGIYVSLNCVLEIHGYNCEKVIVTM